MTQWIPYLVALLGVAFGLRCYLELWRWARQCQRAKVAIAYNRRVQLDAPLTEWLQWANSMSADDQRRGRVVYRNGKVTVAILKQAKQKTTVRTIRKVRRRREKAPT